MAHSARSVLQFTHKKFRYIFTPLTPVVLREREIDFRTGAENFLTQVQKAFSLRPMIFELNRPEFEKIFFELRQNSNFELRPKRKIQTQVVPPTLITSHTSLTERKASAIICQYISIFSLYNESAKM